MRIFFIMLLLLVMCPLAGTGLADDNSYCLSNCANDKRSNDMYCPPAGGYTDEEYKQCAAKNATEYNNCIKLCSPPVTSPADQQSTATPAPSEPLEEPAPTDQPPATDQPALDPNNPE